MAHYIGVVEIDRFNRGEGKIAFAVFGPANFAFNRIARPQTIFAHHIGRDVNIVWTRQIIGFWCPQKAKTIGQHFNCAFADNLFPIFCLNLEDRKHDILFAQCRCALNTQFFGHFDQFSRSFLLELFQVHHGKSVRVK